MAGITLAEKVAKGFSRVKIKKASIKVPKLKIKGKTVKPKTEVSTSSLINILIKNALEKQKKEKKPVIRVEENKDYKSIKREEESVQGGYGSVSKGYGSSPHSSYVDYGKLFSYLGRFRAQNQYDNLESFGEMANEQAQSSFVLADKESMDKIGRFERYMKHPGMAIQTMALSLVPIAGLSSKEWEEVKMMMKLDPVIYTLKTTIA